MESELQEMPKMIVAYIDLLGTKRRMEESAEDALRPIYSYNNILIGNVCEEISHTTESYEKPFQELAKINSINSFDYFLPFSDSIFIASYDCNSFIKQLGNYIFKLYYITRDLYNNPIDTSKPEKVLMHTFSFNQDGTSEIKENTCNYYPALFRGGLSFEDISPIELLGIVNKQPTRIPILTGKSVCNAVKLEGKVKGPRLVLDKNVYDQLDNDTRDYCRTTPEYQDLYEILWPAFNYIKHSKPQHDKLEIDEIRKMLKPTNNLWKAYNHMDCSIHYFNLIELIIASTIQFFDKKCQLKELAKDEVSKWLKDNDMQDKIDIDKY